MNKEKLILGIADEEIREMIQRFHFSESDFAMLKSLTDALTPLLSNNAYYMLCEKDDVIDYDEYALCLVTLGQGFDDMQELYVKNNCIEEAYMLDCIGLVLLGKAYEELTKLIQTKEVKWATKIDFFGDTYGAKLMPDMIKKFDGIEIGINKDLLITPIKSAFYMLPLSDKEVTANPCNICHNCGNISCLFRQKEKVDELREKQHKEFLRRRAIREKEIERVAELTQSQVAFASYGMSQIFSKKSNYEDTTNSN